LYADPTGANCIINPATGIPYNYIAFTNQDRSNFLAKYSAGIRLTHYYPAKGQMVAHSGSIDLGFGQDESITGGALRGAVFKIDGIYPLPFGKLSFIYVFGSASMRLSGNQNYAPLILTVPQGNTTPTIPSANVTVLSLKQPDRDFYRIGFGLDILDIFSKLKSGPESGNAATKASATDSSADGKGDTKTTNTPANPQATKLQ
jgi:hypothetical protein